VALKSESLDDLSKAENFSVDYLSMDVQGGELGVLRGAERILGQQCLAIATEINFEEFYQGQPRADEIFAFCRRNGFRFMRLEPHQGSSWFRGPIGWRGIGATFSGDALFYKDPQIVKATHQDPGISLKKLAMIALVGGYLEYCLECLILLDQSGWDRKRDQEVGFKYIKILCGLFEIYKEEEGVYAPSFSEIYSLEEANRRFQVDYSSVTKFDRANLRKRYFSATSLLKFKENFPKLCAPASTRLEQYLIDSSLARTAKIFRDCRLEHALATARLLGVTREQDGAEVIDLAGLDQLG